MSGLIITAKAFTKQLEKARKEMRQHLDAAIDQAKQMKGCNTNPRESEYYANKVANAIREKEEFDWDEWEDKQIVAITQGFRAQCKMAVALRNIAIDEGLIKSPEGETPKLLDDSPTLGDRFALISIRPEEGTCLVFFEQKIAEFMERPWVLGAEYHFEQIGEDEATMGNGFHVHIVAKCKKSIRVPEIERDATKDLEPVRFSIQIGEKKTESRPKPRKFLKTERDLQYALNYIRGEKHNEDKEDAVALNETWRRINGLQDVYYVGAWDNRESRPDAVIIEEVL